MTALPPTPRDVDTGALSQARPVPAPPTETGTSTSGNEPTAWEFLEAIHPGRPWPLTAIAPEKGPVTALARTAAEVMEFIAKWNGRANIYFTPATPRDLRQAPASGKYRKEDMAGSNWQWVDVDPPADQDLIEWQNRTMIALLGSDPTPTFFVDSGRGYWAFWRRSSFSSDREEIEGINRALGEPVGADNCHNIDRLARLPGTENLKTGQTASAISCQPGTCSSLPAPIAAAAPKASSSGARKVAHMDRAWTDGPEAGWTVEADDDALIRAALESRGSARAIFGDGVTSAQLYSADEEALSKAFPPSKSGDPYDRSKADMALAGRLMHRTGNDCERTLRLMKTSHLERDKWERPNYLRGTILNAWAELPEYRRARQVAENVRIGDDVEDPPRPTVMDADEMLRDLVYVGSQGAVAHRLTGRIRKREAAGGEYAASKHQWVDEKGKTKSCPALKRWMESPNRTDVDVLAWVPGADQICSPSEMVDGNRRAFNTWRGLRPLPAPENWRERVEPFLQHIAYLVPIEVERTRFLQWLAHIIQRPEELSHTCYLMVTEQTGIGRNCLASIMTRVLRGYLAAGISLGPILDGKFNGRLSQKLLATVDETREGMSEKRYARGEALKSLITEEHRHIDVKYGLQTVEKNCCRWLLFSNHYDALPFDNNDRRVIVIQNPTERRSEEYYDYIYGLVDDPHFIGSVRRYLETLDLGNFKAGAHAPMSEAKARALDAQLSEVDKAVREFRGVWPGNLATTSQIRRFVSETNGCYEQSINARHLTEAVKRSGMTSANRQIKYQCRKDRLVIVRELTVDEVKSTAAATLVDVVRTASITFWEENGTAGTAGTAHLKT